MVEAILFEVALEEGILDAEGEVLAGFGDFSEAFDSAEPSTRNGSPKAGKGAAMSASS